ncbi:LysR family transcriptional regulator [Paraburkholderia aromaticivorans]|uniref:LysR family transcriptional regulator n=1 Tax=Paraburkholderia aromaticivorans TaxID=2026199 RepID=A0A248VWV5_9BURK|nr:LysR family transcriptional regulator [Paraburkholderia aromaticivorans]ASW03355.1 LysR family transcriptional regulator [Paraburkholderia aromaticivorans]
MDQADLVIFLRLADSGSLSGTARTLKSPKSTVSRALLRLEMEIGSALFDRSTRHFRLTDTGKLLLPYASRAVHDLQEAQAIIDGYAGEPRGLLRINTTQSFAQGIIAPMLPDFLDRYPELTVELTTDSNYVDIAREGIDIAVRVGTLPDSSLIARRLPPVELWLCASPSYLSRSGVPTQAAELHGHRLVVREAPTSWVFQDGQTELTVQPRGSAIIPDAAAQKIVLEGGGGIGFLPSYLAAPALTAGTLVRVLPSLRRESIELHALYPTHRSMSAKVRAFIDALIVHLDTVKPTSSRD